MYIENFSCKQDVINEFRLNDDELKDCKILLAWYGYGSYDGSAFVLFDRDGKLYEVNGEYCSCYGLEDQWSPEETSVKELRHRITEGRLGRDTYSDGGVFDVALKKILTRWENKNNF